MQKRLFRQRNTGIPGINRPGCRTAIITGRAGCPTLRLPSVRYALPAAERAGQQNRSLLPAFPDSRKYFGKLRKPRHDCLAYTGKNQQNQKKWRQQNHQRAAAPRRPDMNKRRHKECGNQSNMAAQKTCPMQSKNSRCGRNIRPGQRPANPACPCF